MKRSDEDDDGCKFTPDVTKEDVEEASDEKGREMRSRSRFRTGTTRVSAKRKSGRIWRLRGWRGTNNEESSLVGNRLSEVPEGATECPLHIAQRVHLVHSRS